MLLAPMVQIVSETDRTPHMNAFFIGISFPRFQSNRTRNFSEASTTKKPANIRGSTCCIPDPVGLNPPLRFYHWATRWPEQRFAKKEASKRRFFKPPRRRARPVRRARARSSAQRMTPSDKSRSIQCFSTVDAESQPSRRLVQDARLYTGSAPAIGGGRAAGRLGVGLVCRGIEGVPVSDRGTLGGLTQFATQFGFAGSATSL